MLDVVDNENRVKLSKLDNDPWSSFINASFIEVRFVRTVSIVYTITVYCTSDSSLFSRLPCCRLFFMGCTHNTNSINCVKYFLRIPYK